MTEEQIEQYIREHYSDIVKFAAQYAREHNWTLQQATRVRDWLAKFK